MKFWQFRELCHKDKGTRLIVAEGRHQGKTVEFCYTSNSKIVGKFEDGTDIEIAYANVEHIDSEGQPNIVPVNDMTGREILTDSIICYSVATANSHALEIGKVTMISKIGQLKVDVLVHNGEKPRQYARSSKMINDPLRTIKLPADATTVMMWIMGDFEDMKNGAMPQ